MSKIRKLKKLLNKKFPLKKPLINNKKIIAPEEILGQLGRRVRMGNFCL